MALTLSKKNPRGTVGLDLDGAFLAAVQAGGGRISRAASTELPDGVITDGEVTDVEGLSQSLKNFFKQNALPTRVRLGVSNQQIVVRHLELPRIEDADEREPPSASRRPRRSRCRSTRRCSTTRSSASTPAARAARACAWSWLPPARR